MNVDCRIGCQMTWAGLIGSFNCLTWMLDLDSGPL